MIVKKIKVLKNSTSKAVRIPRLTEYIRKQETDKAREKCIYNGARGFITDQPHSQAAEMLALSQDAVRSRNTINHYILSWDEGEQPSSEQVEEAVSIFMDELGLTVHQVIYSLHADTANLHLHLIINRVHPDTLKCVEINKGFDIKAAHRAIARIEHAQGWRRETQGCYNVSESGKLDRRDKDPNQPRRPEQRKCDIEWRTGEKSAERIAIEYGAPIIKQAQEWEQLHRELAKQGMRYEKTGSGATIFIGDIGVKASNADREASLTKLQKRIGAYQPPRSQLQVTRREAEPIKPDMPGWEEYVSGRKSHYAAKEKDKLAQDERQEQERKQLAEQQKARRDELLRGDWKSRGELLNALRSVIAAEQSAEKAALKERHRKERTQFRQKFRPYPDFAQWRQRADKPQRIEGDCNEPPTPRDIRAFVPEIAGRWVRYRRRDKPDAGVSFVDKGRRIDIHDWRDRDTTLAALQLSAQKWGGFQVTGCDEYKALCVKLAAEYGFKISNTELQESIQKARQRRHRESPMP